jgi:hypothetical protein
MSAWEGTVHGSGGARLRVAELVHVREMQSRNAFKLQGNRPSRTARCNECRRCCMLNKGRGTSEEACVCVREYVCVRVEQGCLA